MAEQIVCPECDGFRFVDCSCCGTAEALECDWCDGTGKIDDDEDEDEDD